MLQSPQNWVNRYSTAILTHCRLKAHIFQCLTSFHTLRRLNWNCETLFFSFFSFLVVCVKMGNEIRTLIFNTYWEWKIKKNNDAWFVLRALKSNRVKDECLYSIFVFRICNGLTVRLHFVFRSATTPCGWSWRWRVNATWSSVIRFVRAHSVAPQ